MKPSEKREFADLLAGLLELYGRQITPAAAGMWWSAFERHALSDVRAAFNRYAQDPEQGRYPPTPAAVLGCLPSHSAGERVGADEAWALALKAFDESETVCATDEILEAVAAAAPVWEIGDKIGARMAFKASYERLTTERRQHGIRPTWRLSIGWDTEKRAQAAQEALRIGRITEEQALPYLPAPKAQGAAHAVAGLLTGRVVEFPVSEDAKTRTHLKRLRDAIAGALDGDPKRDQVADRDAFRRRKREAVEAIERMQLARGGE